MKKLLLLLLLFSTIVGKVFSQVVGDFRSAASGVWSTASTWQVWNGTTWNGTTNALLCNSVIGSPNITTTSTSTLTVSMSVTGIGIPPGALIISIVSSTQFIISSPATSTQSSSNLSFSISISSSNSVNIRNGHTITVSGPGPYPCNDLVVDAGGKLFTNGFTQIYISVSGSTITCNGTIGNGNIFDGLSFNIVGSNCRILGTGTFDASRIRKNDATNTTTNLSIERDVKLRFCGGRQTQIYNNANGSAGSQGTRFNVTVAAGATLTCDSTVSAYCLATGSSTTLNVTCSTQAGNINVTTASTTGITAGMMVSGAGIIPGTTVSSVVTGTQFVLSQNALVTNTSNNLTFGGNQITNTTAITSLYGTTFAVPGSIVNCRVYGNGIAPGAYVVSVSGAGPTYNLQLSLPNTGPVSDTIKFVSDGNVAIDGTTGIAIGASAGSFTINGTMLVSGFLYLTTNNGSTVADSSVTWTVNNGGLLKVGNVLTSASGTAKHTFRVAAGGKFEVFGLPGFSTALNATNNIYDIQAGSFTEFSGKGNQNVPVILPFSGPLPSSGYYGNLKISGYGTKSEIATTAYSVFNNFEISNSSGAPKFNGSVALFFNVGGNWINYHDSAYIEADNVNFNRTGVSTITCPSGEEFKTLRYQKTDSSAVRCLSDVKVKTQLSWSNNGHFHLNGNTLTLYNPVPTAIFGATNTSRYILGETGNFNSKVRWNIGTTTAYSRFGIPFAKGSGSANYTPFAFAVDSGVQVDTMTISTYGTPATNLPWPTASPYNVTNLNSYNNLLNPDNSAATVDRFWYVGFSSLNVINDTIALSYASNEIPLSPYNDPTLLKAQYWNPNAGASGSWTLPSLGYYGTLFNVSGVVVPSPLLNNVWALASSSSPLPIELLDFRGKYINNQSVLSWVTASEKDNDYFILERSENARDFTQIGKIDGAGNSNSFLNYQFIDVKPIDQVAYYRLKQVDFDGQYSYSQVIALRNNQKLNAELKAYPNPSNGNFLITNIPFDEGDDFVCQVYNLQGELMRKDLHISDASGNLLLQLNELKSGVYWIRLTNGYTTVSARVILNK
jgi:hypothetical protein